MDNIIKGFETLKVGEKHKKKALNNIQSWLTDPQFASYKPQLEHLKLLFSILSPISHIEQFGHLYS